MAAAKQAIEQSVLPAYQNIIQELKQQQTLSPEGDGVWRLPDGGKWYRNRLAWLTTTDLNAEQLHPIGLQNVGCIFKFMRNEDQFYYSDTDKGRSEYDTS